MMRKIETPTNAVIQNSIILNNGMCWKSPMVNHEKATDCTYEEVLHHTHDNLVVAHLAMMQHDTIVYCAS